MEYIVALDQSTQSTKALLADLSGQVIGKAMLPHRQIIDEHGWINHDPEEIYRNTVCVIKEVVTQNSISPASVVGITISNQRETCLGWNREDGKSLGYAVVWQCPRGEGICSEIKMKDRIKYLTGLPLSPYFSAAKLAWIMENDINARRLASQGLLCLGTIDSYLVFKLTDGDVFRCDYSNAARTQLFDIRNHFWSSELCSAFGLSPSCLPDVVDSDGDFGTTTLDGFFPHEVPVCAVLGDSNSSLYAQRCYSEGQTKVTYGTGSSVMMNTGCGKPVMIDGLSTSIAWSVSGKLDYVIEGNVNYTGAIITWLEKDLGVVADANDTSDMAYSANENDHTYLVPAFSGLGAPYWDDDARGIICGLSRTSGRNEIVKAALDSIAYQVNDIVKLMKEGTGISGIQLMADGGPTANRYLMQRQADISGCRISIPPMSEMSAYGCLLLALRSKFGRDPLQVKGEVYLPQADPCSVKEDYEGWLDAVGCALAAGKRRL